MNSKMLILKKSGEYMKKILYVLLAVFLSQTIANAWPWDYTSLNLKEAQRAQKYGTTNRYFASTNSNNPASAVKVKDPGLIPFGNYEKVDNVKFQAKVKKDEVQYAKIKENLRKNKVDDYNTQAYPKDFYNVYRIAERIIRANNLDYINWRIAIKKTSDGEFNAASSDTNYIVLYTGLYDTLSDNDDAMALVIGHEMAHQLLGHGQRAARIISSRDRQYDFSTDAYANFDAAMRNAIANTKLQKMEYSADVEGAILAARAGYNLDSAKETLSFINTLPYIGFITLSHPNPEKRLRNFDENRKFFVEPQWKLEGKYNIYTSNVLDCRKSSDRTSIIISRGSAKSPDSYYRPETVDEILLRYAYKSYKNGDFEDAEKYFNKLLKKDRGNYILYLYLSYTCEYLYKQTGNDKYLEKAKDAARKGLVFAPNDKYLKEQAAAL